MFTIYLQIFARKIYDLCNMPKNRPRGSRSAGQKIKEGLTLFFLFDFYFLNFKFNLEFTPAAAFEFSIMYAGVFFFIEVGTFHLGGASAVRTFNHFHSLSFFSVSILYHKRGCLSTPFVKIILIIFNQCESDFCFSFITSDNFFGKSFQFKFFDKVKPNFSTPKAIIVIPPSAVFQL